MRKTLAILVLIICSMLLLQAPAWAQTTPSHQLYKIKTGGSFVALSDCPERQIWIRPNEGAPVKRWMKVPGTEAYGSQRANKFVLDTQVPFNPAKLRATCGGEAMKINRKTLLSTGVPKTSLPFTGRPLGAQLLLGTGLLLVGSLLVVLAAQSPPGMLRRRHPRPATPS
jgi:hypothetical protein